MHRSEYASDRNAEIKAWVEEHPDIEAKVEQRIRDAPAQKRRALTNTAKTEAMNQAMRPAGNGIRPS